MGWETGEARLRAARSRLRPLRLLPNSCAAQSAPGFARFSQRISCRARGQTKANATAIEVATNSFPKGNDSALPRKEAPWRNESSQEHRSAGMHHCWHKRLRRLALCGVNDSFFFFKFALRLRPLQFRSSIRSSRLILDFPRALRPPSGLSTNKKRPSPATQSTLA